jgi:hypothetical protein
VGYSGLSGTGFSLLVLNYADAAKFKGKQSEQAAENGICGPQGLKPLMNPMRLRRG